MQKMIRLLRRRGYYIVKKRELPGYFALITFPQENQSTAAKTTTNQQGEDAAGDTSIHTAYSLHQPHLTPTYQGHPKGAEKPKRKSQKAKEDLHDHALGCRTADITNHLPPFLPFFFFFFCYILFIITIFESSGTKQRHSTEFQP